MVTAPSRAGSVRVVTSGAGNDGAIVVAVALVGPPAPPPAPQGWPLTRHERRVVELLVRGWSNRQIAAALSIGEETVEWHLGQVYEKAGEGSRSRLLARYFSESYLLALVPEWRDGEGEETDGVV